MIFDPFGGSFSDNKNYEEEYDNTRCFCSNCNLEYPKGTKFCAECGENLTPIKGLTLSAKKKTNILLNHQKEQQEGNRAYAV